MTYWTEQDLPFYYELARTFPLADRWFSSCLGPTFPNRRGMAGYMAQVRTIDQFFAAEVISWVMHGPGWEDTLLIWLYDEHGGYYDHVPPPAAVPPDDVLGRSPGTHPSRRWTVLRALFPGYARNARKARRQAASIRHLRLPRPGSDRLPVCAAGLGLVGNRQAPRH